jgi:hypothetical protein
MDWLGSASHLHGRSNTLAKRRPALGAHVDFIHRDFCRLQMVDLVASGQQSGADDDYAFSHLPVSLARDGCASVPLFE